MAGLVSIELLELSRAKEAAQHRGIVSGPLGLLSLLELPKLEMPMPWLRSFFLATHSTCWSLPSLVRMHAFGGRVADARDLSSAGTMSLAMDQIE